VKRNHLTVIFMKDTNQPLTYQISVKLLILVVVLLVGIASTYAFFIRGYYTLYRDNVQLEEILRTLKTDMGNLQTTLSGLNEQQTDPIQPAVKQAGNTAEQETSTAQVDSIRIKPDRNMTGSVEIDQLALKADNATRGLNFSFILDNTTEEGSLLRGYLFVVLKSQNNFKLSSFPEVAFTSGLPTDYHQGDRYAIRRFKGYRGQLEYTPEARFLEILVYSDTGKLIAHIKEPVPSS